VHVVTKKGKGYTLAENEPVRFHGIGPFAQDTGEILPPPEPEAKTYTQVFSDKLIALAKEEKKIVAITAAMPEGTGLDRFRDLYPERFFDVGIAEEHAVCFAAGLARQGRKPVVAIYSTFLQRAYDQIIEEVALQELPVIFILDRAGIVGEDGATHQGIFDLAFLRNIPHLVAMAPKDGTELEAMLEFALTLNKPVAIRYPKDKVPNYPLSAIRSTLELGKAEVLKEGKDFVIIALGSMVEPSIEAMDLLWRDGLKGILANARFVKPLDIPLLQNLAKGTKHIFTVEEGVLAGGFGSAIREVIGKPVVSLGLPDEFIPHGRRDILLEKYGLTAAAIAGKIKSVICPK
jgi:1-deoxy-D-xylulose-5-phosphate synthase